MVSYGTDLLRYLARCLVSRIKMLLRSYLMPPTPPQLSNLATEQYFVKRVLKARMSQWLRLSVMLWIKQRLRLVLLAWVLALQRVKLKLQPRKLKQMLKPLPILRHLPPQLVREMRQTKSPRWLVLNIRQPPLLRVPMVRTHLIQRLRKELPRLMQMLRLPMQNMRRLFVS